MKIKIKKKIEKVKDEGEILRILLYKIKIFPESKNDFLKFKELKDDFHFENSFDKKGNLRILF